MAISQTLIVFSPPLVATRRLSRLKAIAGTVYEPPALPESTRSSRPVETSHSLTLLSLKEAVASSRASGLKTKRVAPRKLP